MANKKLTDLTELTTPADGDFLYIVDVSDTTESAQGTSKKIRKDKVDSGASKENIANKSYIHTTDTEKYYSATYVNGVLPTSYSKIVYVNATSPTTATIFDLENPPVTNDNDLKNDTANLYIGTDASTWVYLTGTGYVTKSISSATSNFNTFGTTVDAGNSKTSHITRSGPVTLTGSLNLAVAKISTTPNTSAGSYDILTRNSSTTALEKKLVSDFLQTTGNQSFTGAKTGVSTNATPTILTITNENTASGSFVIDLYNSATASTSGSGALRVYNRNIGDGTSAIQLINESSGRGGFFKNLSTGIGLFFENWSSGIGFQLDSRTGSTGDLIRFTKNNAITTTINHLGEIVTMTPTASGQVAIKSYVDAKITQTIANGVTDKSPSEDAVSDALANVTRNIVKNTVPSTTLTGTVSETILASYLIPANTFSSSDVMNIQSVKFKKTGTAAQAPVKIYTNTASTLSGATQLSMYNITLTASVGKFNRTFTLYGGDLFTINPALSATTDSTSGSLTTVSFNTTIDNYILVVGKLDNSGDSLTLIETLISK